MGYCSPRIFATVIFALVGLGLTACLDRQVGSNDSKTVNYRIYANSEIGYSLTVPNDFAHETDDEEGMYFGYGEKSKFGNIYVQSYDHLAPEHCNDSLTGASVTAELPNANGNAAWGRVDVWDGYGREGWEWPENWQEIKCSKEGTPRPTSVYALCAEKDGSVVVICINEMTDNPQLAKEIFETFRWIK